MKRRSFGAAALGVVALLFTLAGSATGAVGTTGTWSSYPAQTYTDQVITAPGPTVYQAAVRPPLNADGTSNFPARRGVIPVQFDLLAAPSTVTTTTRNYDPPVWESLNGVPGSVSWAKLVLSPRLTFAQITNLTATYSFTTGDCYGGSLRWDIVVTHGGVDQYVEVYYGNPNGAPSPPGQSCSGAQSESGTNLMSTSDPTLPPNRFEMLGGWGVGPQYTTYEDALESTNDGTDLVKRVQLTLDSGWSADQVADVSNVTVNDNTWVPKTSEVVGTSTVPGDFASTCTLPDAQIRWSKTNPNADGTINEDYSVQPRDNGVYYRKVDCKYIYNLDVSNLSGSGIYTVWANINGANVNMPAVFGLK